MVGLPNYERLGPASFDKLRIGLDLSPLRRKNPGNPLTALNEGYRDFQSDVSFNGVGYLDQDGGKHRSWEFVMTLGWSRACYVELVRRADTAAFIRAPAVVTARIAPLVIPSSLPSSLVVRGLAIDTPGPDSGPLQRWVRKAAQGHRDASLPYEVRQDLRSRGL